MQQYVKWDGEKIVKGPQSVAGDDTWLPYIVPDNKPHRAKCTHRHVEGLGIVLEFEEHVPPYQEKRADAYAKLTTQLDLLFHDIGNGTLSTEGEFYKALKEVKDLYPKPEESDGD